MKYIVIVLLLVCYVLLPVNYGYSINSSFVSHIAYNFNHVSLFHLGVNCLGFVTIMGWLENILKRDRWLAYVIPLIVAVECSFIVNVYELPTLGVSGIINAMIGMYLALVMFSKKLRIDNKFKFYLFVGSIATAMILGGVFSSSNWMLHLSCLIMGWIIMMIIIKSKYLD